MKRSDVLTAIRAEVAREGRATHIALRLYVEARNVGFPAFRKAVDEGMAIYARSQQKS